MKPIPEMTKDEIIQELCERLGIQWHIIQEIFFEGHIVEKRICTCGISFWGLTSREARRHKELNNPDFYSDPVSLLREMIKLTNAAAFKIYLWRKAGWLTSDNHEQFMMTFAIPYCYLNGQNDLLPTTTLDWLRKEQGK